MSCRLYEKPGHQHNILAHAVLMFLGRFAIVTVQVFLAASKG